MGLINWLANRVATELKRDDDARLTDALKQLRAEREEEARETRKLVQELDDVLEKTQRMFARMAMRRSREIREAADQIGAEQQPQPEPQIQHRPMTAKERKQQLRANLMGGRFRRAAGDDE
jgi:hypothetical protein